jgi:hypothetical protein
MTKRGWWMGLTLVLATANVARAQEVEARMADDSNRATVSAPAQASEGATTEVTARPATSGGPIAVTRPTTAATGSLVLVPQSANMGQSKAMMIVGGAALLTGAVIGGDAGTIFMVGGAVVGLYGLYQYLK